MLSNSYYTVNMKTLAAAPYVMAGTVWQSSDLANSNLLVTGEKKQSDPIELMRTRPIVNSGNNKIGLFPNPVTANQFIVQFGQMDAGSYTIQVSDATGRQVVQQVVNVNAEGQVQKIKLDANTAKGIYLVKVIDANSKTSFSSKIVVQ
jgi:Secretion system C-terminal sorting domain